MTTNQTSRLNQCMHPRETLFPPPSHAVLSCRIVRHLECSLGTCCLGTALFQPPPRLFCSLLVHSTDCVWHLEAKTGPVQRGPSSPVPQDCAFLGRRVLPCGVLRAAEVQGLFPVRVLRRGCRFRGPGAHHRADKLISHQCQRERIGERCA